MSSFSASRPDDLRVCPTCGAWIRSERSACPWCGTGATTAAPIAASVTETFPTGGVLPPASEEPTRAHARITDDLITEAEPPAPADGPPTPPASQGRRFWRRAFSIAALLVLLSIVGLGSLGAYQGLNDRQVEDQRAAIRFFEQGQTMMEEERYELAVAAFREAVRLEPNFAAAEQMLGVAQHDADVAAGRVPTETPPAEATEANIVAATAIEAAPTETIGLSQEDELFDEAVAAMEREDWAIAATTFDLLTSQSPDYRAEEVADGLFQANMAAGEAALADGALDEAMRHFDQALAARPESALAQQQRRLTSAYRTGQRAFEREDWSMAADQLRTVFLLDPEFLDTTEMLAEAHFNLGQEFETRDIWCSAAQQYRSSIAVVPSDAISRLAQTANGRCVVRATAAPPPIVRASPTRTVGEVALGTITPRPTREGTATVPSGVLTPTATVQGASTPTPITFLPTPTFPPLPTATVPPPPPPPPPTGFALSGGVGENLGAGCGGHYINGTVRAMDGSPLPNVTILARDEYGNRLTAVSKADPPGTYDIPIPSSVIRYQVMIVSGDVVVSPVIDVQHSDRFAQSPQGCHILNWQQTP